MATMLLNRAQICPADADLYVFVPFTSTCPNCRQQQPQRGFSRAALQTLFEAKYPIEAYCVMCDEFWAISAKERTALARELRG